MEKCVRSWGMHGLQWTFRCFGLMLQIFVLPLLLLANFSLKMLWAVGRLISIVCTFFIAGIEGARERINRHYHADEIHYAVLKGNGQYLKLSGETLEAVLVTQLYDYTIRKFMSLGQIESDLKVAEIQFSTPKGLEYIHQYLGIKEVFGFSNKKKKITQMKELTPYNYIQFIQTQYSDVESPNSDPFDIFLFLNSKKEPLSYYNCADYIRVLGWINKNLSQSGYVIFGKYFDSDGEDKVFEELFSSFGLRIEMSEEITPNIKHADKMLKKIHKNRKIAWGFFKGKEMIEKFLEKKNPISKMFQGIKRLAEKFVGRFSGDQKYLVYILEKK